MFQPGGDDGGKNVSENPAHRNKDRKEEFKRLGPCAANRFDQRVLSVTQNKSEGDHGSLACGRGRHGSSASLVALGNQLVWIIKS